MQRKKGWDDDGFQYRIWVTRWASDPNLLSLNYSTESQDRYFRSVRNDFKGKPIIEPFNLGLQEAEADTTPFGRKWSADSLVRADDEIDPEP